MPNEQRNRHAEHDQGPVSLKIFRNDGGLIMRLNRIGTRIHIISGIGPQAAISSP